MPILALLLLAALRCEARAAGAFPLENEPLPPIQLKVDTKADCLGRVAKLCGGKNLRACGLASAGENPTINPSLTPRQRDDSYNEWRFLSFLRHYQRTATLPQAEFFCGNYEREGQRDKRFVDARISPYFPAFPLTETSEKLADAYGLTEAELAAMSGYYGSFYREINPVLRGGSLSPKLSAYKEVLDSALAKLPAYRGAYVMRNTKLPPDALAEHREGGVVTYAAYTSATKSCNSYSFGDHSFSIFASAASQRDFDAYTGTGEVILSPGIHLKVLARRELGEGRIHFVMAQCDADGKLLVTPPEELPLVPSVCR